MKNHLVLMFLAVQFQACTDLEKCATELRAIKVASTSLTLDELIMKIAGNQEVKWQARTEGGFRMDRECSVIAVEIGGYRGDFFLDDKDLMRPVDGRAFVWVKEAQGDVKGQSLP